MNPAVVSPCRQLSAPCLAGSDVPDNLALLSLRDWSAQAAATTRLAAGRLRGGQEHGGGAANSRTVDAGVPIAHIAVMAKTGDETAADGSDATCKTEAGKKGSEYRTGTATTASQRRRPVQLLQVGQVGVDQGIEDATARGTADSDNLAAEIDQSRGQQRGLGNRSSSRIAREQEDMRLRRLMQVCVAASTSAHRLCFRIISCYQVPIRPHAQTRV